ncbi:OLC1v1031321C1 [Oldenlandia corymbosa var. corymbosa]|uniref:OLC1v1031321C1 n=1 Tax=Oldenlandia corymbosa var. corymbosa TaxID=529605 RepID=A0AAV1CLF0_OLDCO|nr:OLC1v1031321C1 [Oldenlandia corymbosa var. corymbosa]
MRQLTKVFKVGQGSNLRPMVKGGGVPSTPPVDYDVDLLDIKDDNDVMFVNSARSRKLDTSLYLCEEVMNQVDVIVFAQYMVDDFVKWNTPNETLMIGIMETCVEEVSNLKRVSSVVLNNIDVEVGGKLLQPENISSVDALCENSNGCSLLLLDKLISYVSLKAKVNPLIRDDINDDANNPVNEDGCVEKVNQGLMGIDIDWTAYAEDNIVSKESLRNEFLSLKGIVCSDDGQVLFENLNKKCVMFSDTFDDTGSLSKVDYPMNLEFMVKELSSVVVELGNGSDVQCNASMGFVSTVQVKPSVWVYDPGIGTTYLAAVMKGVRGDNFIEIEISFHSWLAHDGEEVDIKTFWSKKLRVQWRKMKVSSVSGFIFIIKNVEILLQDAEDLMILKKVYEESLQCSDDEYLGLGVMCWKMRSLKLGLNDSEDIAVISKCELSVAMGFDFSKVKLIIKHGFEFRICNSSFEVEDMKNVALLYYSTLLELELCKIRMDLEPLKVALRNYEINLEFQLHYRQWLAFLCLFSCLEGKAFGRGKVWLCWLGLKQKLGNINITSATILVHHFLHKTESQLDVLDMRLPTKRCTCFWVETSREYTDCLTKFKFVFQPAIEDLGLLNCLLELLAVLQHLWNSLMGLLVVASYKQNFPKKCEQVSIKEILTSETASWSFVLGKQNEAITPYQMALSVDDASSQCTSLAFHDKATWMVISALLNHANFCSLEGKSLMTHIKETHTTWNEVVTSLCLVYTKTKKKTLHSSSSRLECYNYSLSSRISSL